MGDRIHSVDGHLMNGVTREEAVEHLLALPEEVNICVEHNAEEFAHMKSGQVGDSYYIRYIELYLCFTRKNNLLKRLTDYIEYWRNTDMKIHHKNNYFQKYSFG